MLPNMAKAAGNAAGRPPRGPAGRPSGRERGADPPHPAHPGARFILRLVVCWGVAWAILALAPGLETWAIRLTAASVFHTVHSVYPGTVLTGTQVFAAGASLEIISECTPLVPILLLAGAVAAYPAGLRPKLAGISAGIVALWVYNVARLIVLIVVLVRWPAWFDFIHVYLWQTVTVLVAAGLFVAWVRWVAPGR